MAHNNLNEEPARVAYLTGLPVSEETIDVINRLKRNEEVSLNEINELLEIRQAFANIDYSRPTIEIEGRDEIRENALQIMDNFGSVMFDEAGKTNYNGIVENKGRLDIITGLPASGKSSILTNFISHEFKSKVIDNDECKKLLPAFNNGWGATVVHAESKLVSDAAFRLALEGKENIVLPKVGSDPENIRKAYIEPAKEKGYKVYIHYVQVDRSKALGRQLDRFLDTGKFQSPSIIFEYDNPRDGNLCLKAYEDIKNECDGYSHWDNNVSYGESPILKEASKNIDDVIFEIAQNGKEYANDNKERLHKETTISGRLGAGTDRESRAGQSESRGGNGADENGGKQTVKQRAATADGEALQVKESYKAVFYIGKAEQSVTGNSVEECLDAIRQKKAEVKKTSRCYVRKYDKLSDAYVQDGVYLIANGRNITHTVKNQRVSQVSKLLRTKEKSRSNDTHINPSRDNKKLNERG